VKQSLSDIFIAVVDLIEAEGRLLRRGVVITAVALGVVVASFVVMIGGIAYLFGGVYETLEIWMHSGLAKLITGVLAIAVPGAVIWLTVRNLAEPSGAPEKPKQISGP
jgi:hypothetical protein